jgi:pyrrolidone-carboxylate peptidase
VQIHADAPATRDTLLPISAIESALLAIGEAPQHSRDPGRYICNNVMFADIGAMASRGRAGFIHLPYTSQFDDAVRARYGKVVEAAIQAVVDAR